MKTNIKRGLHLVKEFRKKQIQYTELLYTMHKKTCTYESTNLTDADEYSWSDESRWMEPWIDEVCLAPILYVGKYIPVSVINIPNILSMA